MRINQISVLLGAVLALVFAAIPASAWEIKAMNKQIDETNVIVSEICSGTVIDVKNRLVLTAYHCTANSMREVEKKEIDPKTGEIVTKRVQEKIPMFIETWRRFDYEVVSSERHQAKIVGYDSNTDVAILQVIDPDWKPASAAPLAPDNYEYVRGNTVFAVGNPGIVFENSVTTGIISAPARRLTFNERMRDVPLFQHSANTIGGNSGGAIYNDMGQLIGTVTGGVPGSDIGVAVPISFTKELLKKVGFGDLLKK